MAEIIPHCIGIIMDGNRRWAKAQKLEPWEGHAAGNKKFKEVLGWAKEAGIKNVIVYAFSTENWKRSQEEVQHIMDIARIFFSTEIQGLVDSHTRVRFAGDRGRFPADIQEMMQGAEEKTAAYTDYTVMIAASYGGRAEILQAIQSLLTEGVTTVDETVLSGALWTKDFPDPDMIIRTGGEQRLSNFLPWQSTYSELFFTETVWPAFTREEFDALLLAYSARKRNFGA